jgi:LDH2 family malate/lactate/ureidoglycolate dehydrogenase
LALMMGCSVRFRRAAAQEIVQKDSGLDSRYSKFFLALDVEAFVDKERLAQRVQDLLTLVRAIEPGLEITLPGERGWQTRDRYLVEGIPIHPDIAAQLLALGFPLPKATAADRKS